MNRFLLIMLVISNFALADAVDDAFSAQNSRPKNRAILDGGVLDKSDEAKSKVYKRTVEVEEARAQEWREADAHAKDEAVGRNKTDGDWTILKSKSTSGGFEHEYSIKCNVGRRVNVTHTIWKNKGHRKFGQYALSVGFSSVNYDTLEKAAKAGCGLD